MIEKTLADISHATGLLSRLPVPWRRFQHVKTGPDSAWAYPVAGAIVGLVATVIGVLAAGLPEGVQAAVILSAMIVVTGAMHEDGLADSFDGLWGGWDRDRRLEIMKDSRIGTYGVLALILSLLIRWGALSALLSAGYGLIALIGVAALSRLPMVALMVWLPPARRSGLSADVGTPPLRSAGVALAVALFLGLVTIGFQVVWLLIAVGVVGTIWAMIAARKIGGQTGDILGASQQISEIAILLTLSVIWT